MPEGTAEATGSRAGDTAGSVFQRGGTDFGEFRESLGDLGKDKSFEPIKDFNGLAKSFVEAQKLVGSSIRLPKKDMKPEDRQRAIGEITSKLRAEGIMEGVPESPEKYEIKFPEGDEFKPNENLIKSFRSSAHRMGVTPTQAQGLFDWYLNFQQESQVEEEKEFEDAKRNLRKEMGGLYVRRMEAARRAAAKYLGDDGDELISSLPPKIAVRILKAFAEVGDPLLEEEMIGGEIPGVSTVEALKKKMDGITADTKHPLWDEKSPAHKSAVEEWSKLQRELFTLQGRGK